MTKREAEAHFRAFIMPGLAKRSDGSPDYGERRFAWSVFTDGLCKDGEITVAQYMNWAAPKCCKG